NSALYPVYPPGSSGSRSGLPLFAVEQIAEPRAQWIPSPTKSANDWVPAAPPSPATSIASGEPAPKTVGMSMAVFSRTVLAAPTAPKSQPARVYGPHGAGAIFPSSLTISGLVSVVDPAGSNRGAVQ